jgi:hypothetical protein
MLSTRDPHIAYMFIMVHILIRLISRKIFRSVHRVPKNPHLILPWYHYGAVIGNTSLRQDCPVFRVDTPYHHSTLGHK